MENLNLKQLKILKNNILIELRPDVDEVTKTGILLPANKFEELKHGIVLKTGPGRITKKGKRIPVDVKIGEKVRIHFNDCQKTTGKYFQVDGKDCFFMTEDKIIYRY